jgi:hypothetical protein
MYRARQAAALRGEGHDIRTRACDVAAAQAVADPAGAVAEYEPMTTLAGSGGK